MPATQRLKHPVISKKTPTAAARERAMKTRRRQTFDFGEALGASRSFSVVTKPHGPFGAAALLDELKSRLVSRGGRPSDPAPTIRRLVPLKKQVWRRLQRQADLLSSLGKPVSPGQLAAMFLERSISDLDLAQHRKERPQ